MGPVGFAGVSPAPVAPCQPPFEFRARPVAGIPESDGARDAAAGFFLDRVGAVTARLPVAEHAAHHPPGIALGQAISESISGRDFVRKVFVQIAPVGFDELPQDQAFRFEPFGNQELHPFIIADLVEIHVHFSTTIARDRGEAP